jgi:hypothetical protein
MTCKRMIRISVFTALFFIFSFSYASSPLSQIRKEIFWEYDNYLDNLSLVLDKIDDLAIKTEREDIFLLVQAVRRDIDNSRKDILEKKEYEYDSVYEFYGDYMHLRGILLSFKNRINKIVYEF